MIDKDKIIFNTHTYYTCSYSGAIGVKILKLFEDRLCMCTTRKRTHEKAVEIGNITSANERKTKVKRKKFPHKWEKSIKKRASNSRTTIKKY